MAILTDWLRSIDGLSEAEPRPASGDASFRRYFRLHAGQESFIAMDAPPQQEDCRPFIRVAGYLESMQLTAPRVLEANLDDGFLLLSDLGTTQYLEKIQQDVDLAPSLYNDALQALSILQRRGAVFQASLPPYDSELLEFELSLFHDWLCEKHLGIDFGKNDQAMWREVSELLINNALDQPQVFVHRDYHSRNLMVMNDDNPGILDFQDAVEGPLTYDLVSLLKDCYVTWPTETVTEYARTYYTMTGAAVQQQVDEDQFLRYFDLMGAQRHIKAAGIFARLNIRDGKPAYMQDVPRTLDYIVELGDRYDELEPLVQFIRARCLPALQDAT